MPEVVIPSGARTIGGFLVMPKGSGPHPGVVVIHEAFGLNDNIRAITQRVAESGYAALAVDLFAGRNRAICMARFIAGALSGSVNRPGVADLKAALTHLSASPGVDWDRLGAIGFCLGGGFAIDWACSDDRLKAIAPFYAVNPRPIDAVARLCPVVGSYPGRDFTARAGRRLEGALTRYGIPHNIKVYPNARHSFFNDRGPTYQADAAADSWQRVIAFFDAHIRLRPARAD